MIKKWLNRWVKPAHEKRKGRCDCGNSSFVRLYSAKQMVCHCCGKRYKIGLDDEFLVEIKHQR
jgi:hypothetical protein